MVWPPIFCGCRFPTLWVPATDVCMDSREDVSGGTGSGGAECSMGREVGISHSDARLLSGNAHPLHGLESHWSLLVTVWRNPDGLVPEVGLRVFP